MRPLLIFSLMALAVLLALAILPSLSAQTASADASSTIASLTLYSQGSALIYRQVQFQAPQGGNLILRLPNFSASADLSTLVVYPLSGQVDGIKTYREHPADITRMATLPELLSRSVNQTVSVQLAAGFSATGKLAWYSGDYFGLSSPTGLTIYKTSEVSSLSTPVSNLVTSESNDSYNTGLSIALSNLTGGSSTLGVGYLTSAGSFQPQLRIDMANDDSGGAGELSLQALVSNNGDEDWNNTRLSVVVGAPRILSDRPYPYYPLAAGMAAAPSFASSSLPTASVSSDLYTYVFPDPVTLLAGEQALLPMRDNPLTPYIRENIWNPDTGVNPRKIVRINNTGLALPAATASVYVTGQFAGQDRVSYTPHNQNLEIYYADLSDVVGSKEVNQTSAPSNTGIMPAPSNGAAIATDGSAISGTAPTIASNGPAMAPSAPVTMGSGASNAVAPAIAYPARATSTTYSVTLNLTNGAANDQYVTIADSMYGGDKVELLSSSLPAMRIGQYGLQWKVTVPASGRLSVAYAYRVTNYQNGPYPY